MKSVLFLGLFVFLFIGIFTPTSMAASDDWKVDLNVRDNGTGSFTPDNIAIGMAEEPDNFIDPPYPPSPFFAWSIEKGSDSFMELIVETSEGYTWETKITADYSEDDKQQVQPVITWSSNNLPHDKEVLMYVDGGIVDLKRDDSYIWENMQWSYDRAYLEPEFVVGQDIEGYPLTLEDFDISPKLAEPGETVSVTAEVKNLTNEALVREATLYINGNVESSDSIEFSGNQSQTLEFDISRGQEKNYDVRLEVGDETVEGEFRVRKILEGGSFEITNLEVNPRNVRSGDNVEVTGEVQNVGDVLEEQILALYVDNKVEDYEMVELSGGESKSFEFFTSREESGYYNIRVASGDDSQTDNFLVEEYSSTVDVKIENMSVSPEEVRPGQTVTISGLVKNYGEAEQSFGIFFYIENEEESYLPQVELDAGDNYRFEFESSKIEEGDYEGSVRVLGEERSVSFSVSEDQDFPRWILVAIFVTVIISVAIFLAVVVGKDKI